jgi:hypothetical protein
MELRDSIPGFGELVEWCTGWPSFHDAEIVRVDLNRRAPSRLVVHVLGGPRPKFGPRANTKDSVPPDDVVVTFVLEEIEDLELNDFSHQNVLFGLRLEQEASGFQITLDPCYGLAGKITALKVSIEFTPGKPHDALQHNGKK